MGACLEGLRVSKHTYPNERKQEAASSACGHLGIHRKLIFLDVDGPLVCWKNVRAHDWCESESLDSEPYFVHVQAFLRIINGAGGVDVVKVVISSNWRTHPHKYTWLVKELMKRSIEVVGHTDVMKIHPSNAGSAALSRDLEIQRVLEHRVVSAGGLYQTKDGTNAFELAPLPESWQITNWIAIDDLDLTKVEACRLHDIYYLSRFMPVSADLDQGNSWMKPPTKFRAGFCKWMSAFEKEHFVKVDSQKGLGGTQGVEAKAIRLLGGAMNL